MSWKDFFTPVGGMEPEELKAYMEKNREGTYTLLDVRQPSEYEQERIPGSKLIPLPQLGLRLSELDREKPVVVY